MEVLASYSNSWHQNTGCNCSYSRNVDQMCCQGSCMHLSSEEAIAAEESLSIYCKPVELYNILQRRALQNGVVRRTCSIRNGDLFELSCCQPGSFCPVKPPSFLQRCLRYNIQAKRKRRLRTGNVIFNYKYYNNTLQKTEVTEDFSCPFCLVKCTIFKGLRYHLSSSHDMFNFDFWVTDECPVVNVSVKIDIWRSEIVSDGVNPRLQPFYLFSKRWRHRIRKNLVQNANDVHPLESESPELDGDCLHEGLTEKDDGICSFLMHDETVPTDAALCNPLVPKFRKGAQVSKGEKASSSFSSEKVLLNGRQRVENNGLEDPSCADYVERVASSPNTTGVSIAMAQSPVGSECVQSLSGGSLAPPAMLQFSKTKKLPVERSDTRNHLLLQKRQFFHSHRAQPMALEQVLSDRDSEDEFDNDIADFEDVRMLDDFVDVTKAEKHIMHLWNSFVRKQRKKVYLKKLLPENDFFEAENQARADQLGEIQQFSTLGFKVEVGILPCARQGSSGAQKLPWVLADGHIPWACEAFSKFHGQALVRAPSMIWCWRFFMIKLWTHGLLDGLAMNNCNIILEGYQKEISDQKTK